MKNKAKESMLNGRKTVGTFFEMGGNSAVECLAIAGLDYIIVDTEHGPFDAESTADFVRTAKLRGATPFARVKDCTRSSILKMLDIGVEGLIIPYIETVDEVKKLVEYGKYFPLGKRGFAFGRGSGWGSDSFAQNLNEYFETSNRESLIIPQCETIGCLEHIEEIAAMDGVDGIFIGPFDLSVALGKPAQFDDAFKAAVARTLAACKQAGKFSFIYTGDAASGRAYLEQGFDSVAVGIDPMFYIKAFKNLVEEVKG